jgi:hypothetical protein
MRVRTFAAALSLSATPALALAPPPQPTAYQPMRELPPDWLDDADLNAPANDAADRTRGAEGNDRRAHGEQRADVTCKESSGTTGAIVGAVAGGVLGNVIDGGHHRAVGTLVGAGGGALLGRSIEKKQAAAACR